tara:strand:- start:620 stop:1258 length:639 start_codon:yes stop_codon:yes gene_type:complete
MAVRKNSREWTAAEDAWLRDMYPNTSNRKIGEVLGRTYASIKNRATTLQLSKCADYIASAKPGQFSKGQEPWNKGTHFNSGGRSAETRFKPGQIPPNVQPVGTEIIDCYGYLKRKITNDAPKSRGYRNWKFVHVIVWEEHNGPLPKGSIVRFRDSDQNNMDPSNLVALTRGENVVINRWMAMGALPEGGMDALIAMAKLKMLARKRQEEVSQ